MPKPKVEKLAIRWLGLYTIVEVHKNGNYTMADANGKDNQGVCQPGAEVQEKR